MKHSKIKKATVAIDTLADVAICWKGANIKDHPIFLKILGRDEKATEASPAKIRQLEEAAVA